MRTKISTQSSNVGVLATGKKLFLKLTGVASADACLDYSGGESKSALNAASSVVHKMFPMLQGSPQNHRCTAILVVIFSRAFIFKRDCCMGKEKSATKKSKIHVIE